MPPIPAELTRFLRRLRAIRSFSAESVEDGVLEDILSVARWSGSSRNAQPWAFVVVQRQATRDALAALSASARHVQAAPVAILVAMPEELPVTSAYDEGRVAERILLAAAAHGLGAAIGWFGKESRPEVRRLLGLPDDRFVRTAISIGHPAAGAERARSAPGEARRPLAELVHRERW